MIQKFAIEIMINLAAKISAVKTVATKDFILEIINIDINDIYIEMILIKQNTIIVL